MILRCLETTSRCECAKSMPKFHLPDNIIFKSLTGGNPSGNIGWVSNFLTEPNNMQLYLTSDLTAVRYGHLLMLAKIHLLYTLLM